MFFLIGKCSCDMSSTLSEVDSSGYKNPEGGKGEIEGKVVVAPNAPPTPASCRHDTYS